MALQEPDPLCPSCGLDASMMAALRLRIDELEAEARERNEDIQNLERELRVKRAQMTRLRTERDQRATSHRHYDAACEVLEYWRDTCAPRTKEPLAPERMQRVLGRLDGDYTVGELKRCADGYAARPFIVNGRRCETGPTDKRYVDAELIYRDAKHVDTGIMLADMVEAQARAFEAAPGPSAATEAPRQGLGPAGDRALRLAALGWHVLPIVPGGKRPASRNGLKDATTDPERITRFWRDHPDHNVAVRTGQVSGIVVLDVDGVDGFDSLHTLERMRGELPPTLSVTTPRGGQHFYFQHPGGVTMRNTVNFPASGLDFRGDEGYVLVPPSVVDGRAYEPDEVRDPAPLPPWLGEALLKHQERPGPGAGRQEWADFIRQGMQEGERNQRMTSYVGHLIGLGMKAAEVEEHALMMNRQAVKPPLSPREVSSIVKSITTIDLRRKARGDQP